MADDQSMSKAELLDALHSSAREALTRLRALPAAKFEEGRYEGGWNGRQILAHMASIEWTYPRLLDLAAAPPASIQQQGERSATAQGGGIDAYNARQVEKRAGATVAQLLDEFEENRRKTIEAVEAADAALFSVVIRSAGGVSGALAEVFRGVAVGHITAHVRDIVGATQD